MVGIKRSKVISLFFQFHQINSLLPLQVLCVHFCICKFGSFKVERDHFCQEVLMARMKEGCLPSVGIDGDVTTFRPGADCAGAEALLGGWPCQEHWLRFELDSSVRLGCLPSAFTHCSQLVGHWVSLCNMWWLIDVNAFQR